MLEEVREITFEIACWDSMGWISTTPRDVRPAVAAGEDVLALQLVCIMYAGFKRIEPGMDIGVDLGEEWEMAVRLMGEA